MKPKVSGAAGKLLLSYDFPRRIHCSKTYPIPSPNGSTIIISGHELGITVTWRGGRPFKVLKTPASPNPKTNGASGDAIMIIDSDEEVPQLDNSSCDGEAEFEDEENELDPSEPFHEILQSVDVSLGAEVLALSVPSLLPDTARSPEISLPPILTRNIVVAVVCSDCVTRVITLPLGPPPPMTEPQKISGKVNPSRREHILVISGAATHQEIAGEIAISFTSQSLVPGSRSASGPHDTSRDLEGQSNFKSSRNGSRTSARRKSINGDGWDLLMATYSRGGSGVLLIYRIPILEEKTQSKSTSPFSTDHTLPIQRHFLHTHVTRLSFNPSSYPSARHSHLLVSTSKGAVKLYSSACSQVDKPSRGRRTSLSDADPARDLDGKWLISLYPGFTISPSGIPERKAVIDAEWVLSGKAILALLSDGEWGIWDIEGAGPGATQSLVRGQSNVQGVTGGALTSFAINGWITLDAKQSNIGTKEIPKPKLAPMTPGTRKFKEQALFQTANTPTTATFPPPPFARGSISVIAYPSNSQEQESHSDESVIMNYASQNIIIPSLLSHWRTKVKTAGTFESSARFRPTPLEGINLQGENQIGLSQFPAVPMSNHVSYFPSSSARHPDILVVAEHRLLVLAAPLKSSQKQLDPNKTKERPTPAKQHDQALLSRGELDVKGMDRILDGMTNGTATPTPASRAGRKVSPSKQRRVGFA